MKILALSGSRRKNGNTAAVLKTILNVFDEAGAETSLRFPGDLSIQSCRGCEGCSRTNRCVIQDDMQPLYEEIRQADVLLAGSPTYFYNMSSDMKRLIDRCYCFTSYDKTDRSAWISELEGHPQKFAGLVSICEQKNLNDLGFTADAMEAAFSSLGYRIVFSQKILHAFKAGAVTNMDSVLEEARSNGHRLLKTLRLSRQK